MNLVIADFRSLFTPYADESTYPDALLTAQYAVGKCFIEDSDCTLSEDCRAYGLMLMLAHLLYLRDLKNSGNAAGRTITSASEGDVSVSLAEPPSGDTFDYWFNSSSYGQELYVMLSIESAGGFIVGGSPVTSAFRKYNGGF